MAQQQQQRTGNTIATTQGLSGNNPAPLRFDIQMEPIPGLTTKTHIAPKAASIPLGSVVVFKVQAAPSATVTWTGAFEVQRNQNFSIAVSPLTDTGLHEIKATVANGGVAAIDKLDWMVVPEQVSDIRVSKIQVTNLNTTGIDLDAEDMNQESMLHYFGPSIAKVTSLGENFYRTSVSRDLQVKTVVEPAGFEPLMEWRINGDASNTLGGGSVVRTPADRGEHLISVGPVNAETHIFVETYRTYITSHVDMVDIVQPDEKIVYTAFTDPAGYEGEISWLASTKHGYASEWVGQGHTFVTSFHNTYFEGADFEWLGVKADNAIAGQDQKIGACCLENGFCVCCLPEARCVGELGGIYLGDDTNCDGVVCPTTGACCLQDGTCIDATEDDCLAQSGQFNGLGVTCEEVMCVPVCGPGAGDCFSPNGTVGCEDTECCLAICAADPFCCDVEWDGICADAAAATCVDAACCFSDGSCVDTTGADCAAMGGVANLGETCATFDCPVLVNDNCEDALAVGDGCTTFTNIGATTDGAPDPLCLKFGDDNVQSDVWFCYTATADGPVTISLCTSTYDTKVAAYDGCDPIGAILACNDDFCALQSEIVISAVAGNDYKIRVGGFGGAQGNGELCISGGATVGACCFPDGSCADLVEIDCTNGGGDWQGGGTVCEPVNPCPQPVTNDDCADAIAIGAGVTAVNNMGATTDGVADPLCLAFGDDNVNQDVWYCYTASADGNATVSLCGSLYDTKVAVYDGCSCPTGNDILACNDDSCGLQSETSIAITDGNSYLIRVGAFGGESGTGTLTITEN